MEPVETNGDKAKHIYHLVLLQRDEEVLDRELVRRIQREIRKEIKTSPEETQIDIWLESPGGDAHATYKLFLELRQRCETLQCVILDYAKSAATLLVLGMDKIYMDSAAELGPLDVQINHPDREDFVVSGLDVAGALEFLNQTAVSSVVSGGAVILKYTDMNRSEVLKSMLQFETQFMQPMVAKLDPHIIHRAAKQLKVAERYAKVMLKSRKVTDKWKMSDDVARRLINKLVNEYPAHEFVISRDEARELGLPICYIEEHPRHDLISRFADLARSGKMPSMVVIDDAQFEKAQTQTHPDNELRGSDHDETNNNGTTDAKTRSAGVEAAAAADGHESNGIA